MLHLTFRKWNASVGITNSKTFLGAELERDGSEATHVSEGTQCPAKQALIVTREGSGKHPGL